MTLLSICASFGALVWVFQEGNLSDVLAFEPLGLHHRRQPDHHVQRDLRAVDGLRGPAAVADPGGIPADAATTRASVAEGLARTAGVITGAAMIMVTVFGAFALAETITIKSIGVGMAIAVFVDATIIRVLLVPATMRLIGDGTGGRPGSSVAWSTGSGSAT